MSWLIPIGFGLLASTWICSIWALVNTHRILDRLKQPQMAERKPSAPWRPNQIHDMGPPVETGANWRAACSCGWTAIAPQGQIIDRMEQHRLETASKRRTA